MNNKILVKKIVKITPVKEVFDLAIIKFQDGSESIAVYEHFRKNDFAVVISSDFIFKEWFLNIFSRHLKRDSFALPIRFFNRLKPFHNGDGIIQHFEKDGLDVTDILSHDSKIPKSLDEALKDE